MTLLFKKQTVLRSLLLLFLGSSNVVLADTLGGDSVVTMPRKYNILISPIHLLSRQVRMDVEIFSKKYRPNAIITNNSYTFTTRLYRDNILRFYDHYGEHLKGWGLDFSQKFYLNNRLFKTDDSFRFYVGYGIGANYMNYEELKYSSQDWNSYWQSYKFMRYQAFAMLGAQKTFNHLVFDYYMGVGYKYTHYLSKEKSYDYLHNSDLTIPDYTGFYPFVGVKIGFQSGKKK